MIRQIKFPVSVGFLALVLLIFVFGSYFIYFGNPLEAFKYHKMFVNYLDQKYSDPMVVKTVQYNFKQNYYYANAYPAGDKNLEFKVIENIIKNNITDNLLLIQYDEKAQNIMNPKLNELFGDKASLTIDTFQSFGLKDKEEMMTKEYLSGQRRLDSEIQRFLILDFKIKIDDVVSDNSLRKVLDTVYFTKQQKDIKLTRINFIFVKTSNITDIDMDYNTFLGIHSIDDLKMLSQK